MNTSTSATPGRAYGAPLAALFLLLMGAQFLLLSVGAHQVLLWIVGAALGVTCITPRLVSRRLGECLFVSDAVPACEHKW